MRKTKTKTILVSIIATLLVCGLLVGGYFVYSKYRNNKQNIDNLTKQLNDLKSELDAQKKATEDAKKQSETQSGPTNSPSTVQETCAPFPTQEADTDCSKLTGYEGFSCQMDNIEKQRVYERAKEAWYAENQNCR